MELRNWAENIQLSSASLHSPRSVEELQGIVRAARKVKVLGARHSFNDIAAIDAQPETDEGVQSRGPGVAASSSWAYISLAQLDLPLTFDFNRGAVTCPAGITYGELCQKMHESGVALHNMASLPHITVAGACATGTHGSGDSNGNLSTAVVGLEMVTADGALRSLTLEKDGENFKGALIGLGGLGVVTRLTLAAEPAYGMRQTVYEDLPVTQLYQQFEQIMSGAYSVSLFTDWQDGTVNQVWLKRRTGPWVERDGQSGASATSSSSTHSQTDPAEIFGAASAPTHRHPVTRFPPEPCTPQMGLPGPWHERLPHFLVDSTPASGNELQTEYFVPRVFAVPALQAVERLGDRFGELLWISEVRSVAADRLWLSQSYGTPTIGIHFSWKKEWPAVREVLGAVEEALTPFDVRPHWGKLFTLPTEQVQAAFPRMADFRALLESTDPEGKFRNGYLDRFVWGR